jgi:hypothetical protein
MLTRRAAATWSTLVAVLSVRAAGTFFSLA